MNREKILILIGPTAVGKTEYSIDIAKVFNGEIISADSMQIYKYMNIGSAKPTEKERKEAVHHLVDEIDPRQPFSVFEYQNKAKEYIKEVQSRDKLPIISGGTGLYINSLIYRMDFGVIPSQSSMRSSLEEELRIYGNQFLHDKLKKADSAAAERIHPNNVKKIIRALEVLETGGEPIKKFEDSFVQTEDYDYILICLTRDREELYSRINQRVDSLMNMGLLDEVKSLSKIGLSYEDISMKGIGYKELLAHLNGEYDLAEAVRLIKRNTRHYAKRQLTWFKRYPNALWVNLTSFDSKELALDYILKVCRDKLEVSNVEA